MKVKNPQKAHVITLTELTERHRALPDSLLKAAGLLRGDKHKALLRHVDGVHREWSRSATA